jgi:hypothetical protein
MEPMKISTHKSASEPQGPMCRLDMKPMGLGKTTAAGTGAVSSAFMGFLV